MHIFTNLAAVYIFNDTYQHTFCVTFELFFSSSTKFSRKMVCTVKYLPLQTTWQPTDCILAANQNYKSVCITIWWTQQRNKPEQKVLLLWNNLHIFKDWNQLVTSCSLVRLHYRCWQTFQYYTQLSTQFQFIISGVGTGGSGGSMNRGPELLGPRVVGPQKIFRQDS